MRILERQICHTKTHYGGNAIHEVLLYSWSGYFKRLKITKTLGGELVNKQLRGGQNVVVHWLTAGFRFLHWMLGHEQDRYCMYNNITLRHNVQP